MNLEIIEKCNVFEPILFENLIISFLEKPFELEDKIIQNTFVFIGLLQKSIDEMHEFITSYDGVDESGNLVGNHNMRIIYYIFPQV